MAEDLPDKAMALRRALFEAREERDASKAEVERLRAVLQDVADHGLRADLNPTAPMHDTGQLYDHLVSYLRRCDAGIREQARRALGGTDER